MRQVKYIICLGLVLTLHLYGCQKEEPMLITKEETDVTSESVLQQSESTEDEFTGSEVQDTAHRTKEICVYVCGAVAQSGVYTLPEGSRVYEAIAAAGGLTEDADEYYVNQAQILTDGMQITVPVRGESPGQITDSGVSADGRINLNRATEEELQMLKGIGEVKAAAIVAYREAHGSFSSIEEITKVDGISEKLYEKIKEQIVV